MAVVIFDRPLSADRLRCRRRRSLTQVVMAIVAAGVVSATTVIAGPVPPAAAEDAVTNLPGVTTVTGLAADQEREHFWAVATPGKAEVMAVGQSGVLTLNTEVTDIEALSWRDGVLYVGDIGDQQGKRESIRVLRVAEPRPGTRNPQVLTFTYPDGPQDAATLMVSPKGNIYLVTRGATPGIYRPSSTPRAGSTVTLRRLADAPAGVTDGTFTADGTQFALTTPTGVHLIDAYDFTAKALGPVPGGRAAQAITTGLQGSPLVVAVGPKLAPMSVPRGFVSTTPVPSASPRASGSGQPASAQPSQVPPSQETRAWSSQARGTLMALAVALVVAIIAGGATLVGRRR